MQIQTFSTDNSSWPTSAIWKHFIGTMIARHLVGTKSMNWTKAEIMKIRSKIQCSLKAKTVLFTRNVNVCLQYNWTGEGFIHNDIYFILSPLTFCQISTSVNHAMVVVHINVLTHTAPITAHVEMASGYAPTNRDVPVSLIIFLPIYTLSLSSRLGIILTVGRAILQHSKLSCMYTGKVMVLYSWAECKTNWCM